MAQKLPLENRSRESSDRISWAWYLLPLAAAIWAAWPTFTALADRWETDAQYSHGYFIPVLAAVVLWVRRHKLRTSFGATFSEWPVWGLSAILAACAVHIVSGYMEVEFLAGLYVPLTLVGLAWVAFGLRGVRWSWPAVALSLLMIPWPFRMETAIQQFLRRLATHGSVFALQTVGLGAISEGNIIHTATGDIGVIEACSGLNVLMVSLAAAIVFATFSDRGTLVRIGLVVTGVFAALFANIARISLMGIFQAWNLVGEGASWSGFFHDSAGLLMPVLVVLELGGAAMLANWLVPEAHEDAPIGILAPK